MRPTKTTVYVEARSSSNTSLKSKGFQKRIYDFIKSDDFKTCLEIGILVAAFFSFLANAAVAQYQYEANKIYQRSADLSQQSVIVAQQANAVSKEALMDSHIPWLDVKAIGITCRDGVIGGGLGQTITLKLQFTNCSDYPAFLSSAECWVDAPTPMGMERAGNFFMGPHDSAVLMPHIPTMRVIEMPGFNILNEPMVPSILDKLIAQNIPIKIEVNYGDMAQRIFTFRESLFTNGTDFYTDMPRIFGPGLSGDPIQDKIKNGR